MYGQQPRHHRYGTGRGAAPPVAQDPAADINTNLLPQYLNLYHQYPNQYFQNPNFPVRTPNFYSQAPIFPPDQAFQSRPSRRNEILERINRAVVKAHRDLLAARENVSAWKVSQTALLTLKVESWDSLGVQMQQVPSLHRLIIIEGKINGFIHCFVAVQRITSLYDLEVAICMNEGVERFEDLELGPLVLHPLVMHYFSVSPDSTEVFKITSEEVISCLREFTNTQKDIEIKVEEFLDYIAKKRSVTGSEKLSVRIQSLGLHISLIRQARRSESSTVKKIFDDIKKKSEKRRCKRRPLLCLQKKQLDDHFSSISQRLNSFSPLRGDFGGKHIIFSSSSEDDVSDDSEHEGSKNDADAKNNTQFLSKSTTCDRVSSCPYPSAAEEMSRLGFKGEMYVSASASSGSERYNQSNGQSEKKRKLENLCRNNTTPHKLPKKDMIGSDCLIDEAKKEFIGQNGADILLEADLSLPNSSMKMFITTWKEACRENTIEEVFERMLTFYKETGQTRHKEKGMFATVGPRKKMMSMFSSYPCIGLLNVAVESIKCGMWDSVYDAFQSFTEQGATNAILEKCAEYESIEIEPAERDALIIAEHVSKCEQSVTVEDIVKEASTYFELHFDILSNVKSSLEKKFTLMRKLCECERWITNQFSVEEFQSLGYGDFFTFLEKHVYLMPNALQTCLTDYAREKSPLEVCMLQHQLAILLSQASNSLGGMENVTKEMISVLLMKQFPQISFIFVESGSSKDVSCIVRENESTSTCVLFSMTLLGNCTGDSVNEKALSKTAAEGTKIGHKIGTLGSFTTKDAIEVLLRAPMLADLALWTHWDLIFAPSLGPLVGWLLNEVNTKELLCLVTKDGKVIRVDHTSTIDSFLEASLQGSSFQTAVKLLSLLSLYGGERHVPLPLLKCYARQAFEVFTKNFMEVNENQISRTHGKSLYRLHMSDEEAAGLNTDLRRSKSAVHAEVIVVARFFIDCLGHFPTEFRPFAAEILLSGLQSVIKDAPLAILGKCMRIEQRLMLHEVGLSLGIVEWIDDYHVFCSDTTSDSFLSSGVSCLSAVSSEFSSGSTGIQDATNKFAYTQGETVISIESGQKNEECSVVCYGFNNEKNTVDCFSDEHLSATDKENEAALIIESIRHEEFGLNPRLLQEESSMLKKQHARLGRALHCLSQELYSQDSHFLLELVQNADDNVYPQNVEPTLSFILQESGIIVLNNEQGFSEQNIRALCDVGNSTKKGSSAGYIGKKGIGFKSVFRVTDAPEIHSNGFHVKFDITEGQIGFVLPTVVPPCDINLFRRLSCCGIDNMDTICWNTSIVLPFRNNVSKGSAMNSIKHMFSDLHPSLLLFLHRLRCICFRDIFSDSMIIMRKQNAGNGIVKVSIGKETMTWFVESQELQADTIRPDVETTEISIAFTLHECDNGNFIPRLDQQPVFAFLPLRKYGLKFIVQGDFVLPSSREEVDGDSPWNQWLLSKFPDLFVGAERSFCALPCFRENPGKAVAAFMSFVPLVGEVHGFFSSLPHLIISKLRTSKCLLMEGDNNEWVLPCKVMRCWNEQARSLLRDSLLHEHLGLQFLDRDIVLSDSLARDLGIEEYGPRVLLQVISSLCHSENGLKSVGLVWLSSWLNTLYTMVYNSSGRSSIDSGPASDAINTLKKIPFIPLSDGTYSSLDDGTIWLHSDSVSPRLDIDHGPKAFPLLYAQLRTVSPAFLSATVTVDISCLDESVMSNIIRMLQRVGVQQVSAHEIVVIHILPALSDDKIPVDKKTLMIEYLSFVMLHLQSSCPNCLMGRGQLISELHNKAFILTNHGYKRSADVSIHFSAEFGNPIDVDKLISGMDLKWHEVDVAYLKHPMTGSLPGGMMKWREFFQEIGITDFVKVVPVEKKITDLSLLVLKNMLWDGDAIFHGAIAKDWESPELFHLLSQLSSSGDLIRCKVLLEVLDTLWDDCFNDKATGQYILNSPGDNRTFQSSFMSSLCGVRWMVSIMDDELHYSKDLFHDCDAVRAILGAIAPYAVPKVKSEKFLCNVGFRTEVSLDDILVVLQVWRRSKTPFMASIAQMTKFYTFIWNQMATSKQTIFEELHLGPFIFFPHSVGQRHEDVVPGVFFTPDEVYWHDLTGSMNQVKEIHTQSGPSATDRSLCKTLCNVYPGLHDFFVNECGVNEEPRLRSYLEILLQLATVALPSQAANMVFRVFLQWSNGVRSGILSHEDLSYLKECLVKLEFAVLPTVLDKWVSLHPSFGLICWCDDENLKKEFKHFDNIDFLYFGKLSDDEQEMLRVKVSVLLQSLGIPALSKVITRDAIHYGLVDCSFKASLLNWVLPYAQRYIYNGHHDRYSQLKHTGFENLSHLQIVIVEKLFYRNVLARSGIASKKRFECSCLLLGNVLYATRESDSHALFMELSRLLFGGTPDLHLANFLHMITTMVESGSNEEQIEFFILNSQKVPKLADGESVWSLPSIAPSTSNDETQTALTLTTVQQNPNKSKRKPAINSNWPPADWKTAPGFSISHLSQYRAEEAVPPPSCSQHVMEDSFEEKIAQMDPITRININSAWTVEDVAYNPVLSEASDINSVASLFETAYDSSDLVSASDDPNLMVHNNSERDQFSFGTPRATAAKLTGRLGELVAFNYFTAKFGEKSVTWVNKDEESWLPYDIVIEEEGKSKEYIEVKATKSSRKDWFLISSREWQFAFEKGESFSIVHVGLLDSNNNRARITLFKNPVRLCHLGKLQLAVVMPKQLQEFSTVS